MDLPEPSEYGNARIRAVEAEARIVIKKCKEEAGQLLADAASETGGNIPGPLDLDISGFRFAREEARQILREGYSEATRILFDALAAEYFGDVSDPQVFIGLLDAVRDQVAEKLAGEMDRETAELLQLEWEKQAWTRAAMAEADWVGCGRADGNQRLESLRKPQCEPNDEPIPNASDATPEQTFSANVAKTSDRNGPGRRAGIPPNRPHSNFSDFLACVSTRAGEEKMEVLRRGPAKGNLWMLGGLPQFGEFKTAAGIEALRNVWDRLPELKEKGKGAIQAALSRDLHDQFPEDSSVIIASAIWSCILLHDDRNESEQSMDEPRERADGGGVEGKYEDALLEVAAAEVKRLPPEPQADEPTDPPRTVSRWEEIEVRFLSNHRVQITIGGSTETRNYAEFGFEDGRTQKPNLAWVTLRSLA
jgi:hypothetical protein